MGKVKNEFLNKGYLNQHITQTQCSKVKQQKIPPLTRRYLPNQKWQEYQEETEYYSLCQVAKTIRLPHSSTGCQ